MNIGRFFTCVGFCIMSAQKLNYVAGFCGIERDLCVSYDTDEISFTVN